MLVARFARDPAGLGVETRLTHARLSLTPVSVIKHAGIEKRLPPPQKAAIIASAAPAKPRTCGDHAQRNGKVTTMGPLAGFRIIEMAGIGPAPFAATLLADMGAEVI